MPGNTYSRVLMPPWVCSVLRKPLLPRDSKALVKEQRTSNPHRTKLSNPYLTSIWTSRSFYRSLKSTTHSRFCTKISAARNTTSTNNPKKGISHAYRKRHRTALSNASFHHGGLAPGTPKKRQQQRSRSRRVFRTSRRRRVQ